MFAKCLGSNVCVKFAKFCGQRFANYLAHLCSCNFFTHVGIANIRTRIDKVITVVWALRPYKARVMTNVTNKEIQTGQLEL